MGSERAVPDRRDAARHARLGPYVQHDAWWQSGAHLLPLLLLVVLIGVIVWGVLRLSSTGALAIAGPGSRAGRPRRRPVPRPATRRLKRCGSVTLAVSSIAQTSSSAAPTWAGRRTRMLRPTEPSRGAACARPGVSMTGSTAASEPDAPASGSVSARVLVVDDEAAIADLVPTALRYEGFEVSTAGDGRAALEAVEAFRPDLIVLDVMLPDLDGFEVQPPAARPRAARAGAVPHRARRDRGQGARPHARRRRLRDEAVQPRGAGRADPRGPAPRRQGEPRRSRASLRRPRDGRRRPTRLRAGAAIALSPTEYNLLRYLLVNQGRVLSKAQILDHVWHYDFGGDGGVVETYIGYLRRKLDRRAPPDPHGPRRRVRAARRRRRPDVAARPPAARHGRARRARAADRRRRHVPRAVVVAAPTGRRADQHR